jgi:hypothetical protein
VEMLGETTLQVGSEAQIQVTVVHGEQDVDAVLEFGWHPRSRAELTAGRKSEMRVEERRNAPCFSLLGLENQGGRQCSIACGSLHRHTANRRFCCMAPQAIQETELGSP